MINSSEKIVFHVQTRDVRGTGKVKKLRSAGKIAGNIFGLKKDSTSILMDEKDFRKLYESHGDSGLLYLEIDENKDQVPVLIDSIDVKPVGSKVLHVAFKRVDLKITVETDVDVEMVGEADIPQSIVTLVKDSVTIEALPADIPDKFEIDISVLTEIGQSLSLADLKVDTSKLTLVLEEDETPENITLVVVQEVKEEVEPEEEVAAPEDIENGNGEEDKEASDESKEGGNKA
jgi:large subunit ribosomal protein L25